MNLITVLHQELSRNRELLDEYKKIPTGAFGAMCIKNSINHAEKTIADGNIATMIRALKSLQGNN